MEKVIENWFEQISFSYSVIVIVFFGLIVPFVWSYAKDLLDQLYNFKKNPERKCLILVEAPQKGLTIVESKEEVLIRRFFYSMDLLVYSGGMYAIFSFGIALSIGFSGALSIIFVQKLIFWIIVLNFICQYSLFWYIVLKEGLKDWEARKNRFIYSIILIILSISYSWAFCRFGLRYNNFGCLLMEMFFVIVIYLILILIPPLTDRPVTALNSLRGILPD